MENLNLIKNISILVVLALLILILKYSFHGHLRPSDDNHFLKLETFNFINTTTSFQANFWPYGETTFNYPTMRSCDGRLILDFIAKYAKLPFIPPYMQLSNNHQFSIGVNFVSSGAGPVVETFKGLAIDLKTQVAYFKKVEKSLMKQLGCCDDNVDEDVVVDDNDVFDDDDDDDDDVDKDVVDDDDDVLMKRNTQLDEDEHPASISLSLCSSSSKRKEKNK
ncbi:hypothetical protein ACSBR1_025355 [Camellia fascicularis]